MGFPITAGKRGRHCSGDNGDSSSNSSLSTNVVATDSEGSASSEDMKVKRPRDVSPPINETEKHDNMSGGEPLPGCSKEYSLVVSSSVISSDLACAEEEEKLCHFSDLKIRTSVPKLIKNMNQQVRRRGPSVSACRSRTAYPRKMSPKNLKKAKKLNSTGSTDLSSNGSSSASSSASEPNPLLFAEEDYADFEEDSDAESDEDVESIATSATTSSSIDVIPPECGNGVSIEVVPAIRPSYFPNVPPYINFCLHNQKTESLPKEIQKHLKWRLSNITPVVVKKTLNNSGFRLLRKTVEWGGHWGRHMKAALFKTSLKDFQKLNHLPGTFQIGRKDRLWRNIQRYANKFGKNEFGFMPKSFVLPLETKQLKAAWDSSDAKGQLWIVKPPALARGTGIRVVNRWSQVPKKKPIIVQSYIGNPYLINDRKFDLRLYVLVTSFHPLKVYLYNDGLVRFAPVKYSNDTKRAGDRFMHLTNYSINKNCELYTHNEDADATEGHKWTLKTLWRHFVKEGKNVENLWSEIEEIVIKTLICAEDPITNACSCYMPNLYNGYELLGFDIILDAELKPWLLEVNISPSLHSSSPLDLAVKGPMIKELLNIVGYHLPPKLSPLLKKMFAASLDVPLELESPCFDKRLYANTLSKDEAAKHKHFKTKWNKRAEYLEELIETLAPDDIRQLIIAEDELSQCYNFCRIFPTTSTHSYAPYFELPRYYNMLLDAWEAKYHHDRPLGVQRLVAMCRQKIHLQVPQGGGSVIFDNPIPEETEAETEGLPVTNECEETIIKSDDQSQLLPTNEKAGVLDNITNNLSLSAASSPVLKDNSVSKSNGNSPTGIPLSKGVLC